jgi:hypothetical protein
MNYIGDFTTGAIVRLHYTTHAANQSLVAPSAAFVASDFRVYKDDWATQKTTANGITVTSPFDSITGRHLIVIDTSNNTGDTGFFAAGSDYRVELNSDKTVDGITQSGVVIATFSLLNRSNLNAAGIRSAVGLTSADLGTRLTNIQNSFTTNTNAIADAVAERIGSIGLSLQALNGLSDGDTLTVFAGDDYTGIHSQRIDITSTANLSGKRLLICATHQSKNTKFTLAANIQGTTGAHFVTFNPSAELTETWDTGTWTLQYKLELELNKNKTLQSGTLIVRPFDAGTPIVQL